MSTSTSSSNTQSKAYTRRNKAQWKELIDNFEQSDLSLGAYCQENGIATSGFYAWRKRFTSEQESTASEALVDITSQLRAQSTEMKPDSSMWQVELELGHDCVLRIRTA